MSRAELKKMEAEGRAWTAFEPTLATLRYSGFALPGQLFQLLVQMTISALYIVTLGLVVTDMTTARFTLRTTAEYFSIVTITSIAFSRRLFVWRNVGVTEKMLGTFKDEYKFTNESFELHRRETDNSAKSKTATYNWTFCGMRTMLFCIIVAYSVQNILHPIPLTPHIAGRPVFFKMWLFNYTEITNGAYYLVLALQFTVMSLNLLSMAAVDGLINTLMLTYAGRARMLKKIAPTALQPAACGHEKVTNDFSEWVTYYDRLEGSLAAAEDFSGPLLVWPSLTSISMFMVYGLELIRRKDPQSFYIVASTAVQLFASHNAGQTFTNNCAKLICEVSRLPLTSDEGLTPGYFKANLMTQGALLSSSRRLRGFSANGIFKMSIEFFILVVLGSTGYVLLVNLIRK